MKDAILALIATIQSGMENEYMALADYTYALYNDEDTEILDAMDAAYFRVGDGEEW